MSFVDTDSPDGPRWLGGLNTRADTFADAITWSHLAGLNPGGEIQAVGVRATAMDPNYLDRLITDPNEWRNQPMPTDPAPLEDDPAHLGTPPNGVGGGA